MSRQIDWSKPVSAEDKAWAAQFDGIHGQLLQQNAEAFPEAPEPSLEAEDPEDVPYPKWTKAELISEAKRRNNEDGKELPTSGTVATLVEALEADDEDSE